MVTVVIDFAYHCYYFYGEEGGSLLLLEYFIIPIITPVSELMIVLY